MLIKTALLGLSVSFPLLLISATIQDPQDGKKAAATEQTTETSECASPTKPSEPSEITSLRARIESLKAEVAKAQRATADAKLQADFTQVRNTTVKIELSEALDLIANSAPVQSRSDHSPSCRRSSTRARSLLTYYQWMHERGHAERADKMMNRVVEAAGNDANHLNQLAWSLMTEKEHSGKFNASALALAKRMQTKRRLDHRQLDTVALAMFLNGEVKEAVKSQKKALKQSNRDEYRRRLMVYQAAEKNRAKQALSVVKKKAAKAKKATLVAARD